MRVEEMTIAGQAQWFYSFQEKYPDIFDTGEMAHYWGWALDEKSDKERGYLLRAALLKKARTVCDGCKSCDLFKHRLAGRSVFDDASKYSDPFYLGEPTGLIGAYRAEIMVVAEGPGQFEQRTGIPFVSPLVLTGSPCAAGCGEYEKCYPQKATEPRQPCKPSSLPITNLLEIPELIKARASKIWGIQTAGSLLDTIIMHCGLWREGWNDRQAALGPGTKPPPKAGTVYLTNIVRCRSCAPNEDKASGWEDVPPTKEQAEACRRWLNLQIELVQPKVIIALGAPAITGLLGIKDPKVTKIVGEIHEGPYGLPTICAIHPSYALRKGESVVTDDIMSKIVAVFQKAKALAKGEEEVPWALPKVTTATEPLATVDVPTPPAPSEAVYVETFPE